MSKSDSKTEPRPHPPPVPKRRVQQQPTTDGLRPAVLALLLTSPRPLTTNEIVSALVCRYRDQSIITEIENLDEESRITVLCAANQPGAPIVYTHFDRLPELRRAGLLGAIRQRDFFHLSGWAGWVAEL